MNRSSGTPHFSNTKQKEEQEKWDQDIHEAIKIYKESKYLKKDFSFYLNDLNDDMENSDIFNTNDDKQKISELLKTLSTLTDLSLNYEDLYHQRKEVIQSALFHSVVSDLSTGIDRISLYNENLKDLSENISSQEELQIPLNEIDNKLRSLEKCFFE